MKVADGLRGMTLDIAIDSALRRNKVNSEMTWRKYITNPETGKPFRGAFFRIANRLRVHSQMVKRWHEGDTVPTIDESKELQNLVHSRMSLKPKKRSDAGEKRGKYKKRISLSDA